MELRQLLYFKMLAEKLNITETAECLYMSPQVLGKSMRKLADEFGEPLFYRNRNKLVLTKFGEMFYQDSLKVLQQFTDLEEKFHNIAKQNRKQITVGISQGLLFGKIERFFKQYRHKHPDVIFEIIELPDVIVEDALHKGEFDFALTIGPNSYVTDINYQLLQKNQICAVVHYQHPLAENSEVSLLDCCCYPLLTKNKYFKVSRIVDSYAAHRKIQLQYQLQSPNEISWINLVLSTDCIGIGTTFFGENEKAKAKVIPFVEKELSWDIYLAYRQNYFLSSTTQHLISQILNSFNQG